MAVLPEKTNFYSTLHTVKSRQEVGELFKAAGWKLVKPDDVDHLEVRCAWAELVIDSSGPLLLHGCVEKVIVNGLGILALLANNGVAFNAECYHPDGQLLYEWA